MHTAIIIGMAVWLTGMGIILCLCRAARLGDEQLERLAAEHARTHTPDTRHQPAH